MSRNFLGSTATSAPAPAPGPAGPVQQDGNVIAQQLAPTKAPLRTQSASPAHLNTSGLERAMGAHADKLHPTKRR
jgi:hypothetical protein